MNVIVVENTVDQEKGSKEQTMRAYYVCQTSAVRLEYNFSDSLEQCKLLDTGQRNSA